MVNEEIVGGIQRAMKNKESLRDSMMSFYNAGYGKEEIEEAARVFLERQKPTTNNLPSKPNKSPKNKPIPKKNRHPKKIKSSKKNKKVSSYPSKKNKKMILAITLITILGVTTIAIATLIIIFRQEIISFLNGLF